MGIDNLGQLLFIGYVSSRNDAKGTVIVTRPDKDGQVTNELRVLQRGTKEAKEYWMPAIDDQVLCLRLPNVSGKGAGAGYVLGAFYSDTDAPEESDADVRSVRFPDGSYIRYDHGNIEIHATGNITITGANIYLN